jgi:thioredoxin
MKNAFIAFLLCFSALSQGLVAQNTNASTLDPNEFEKGIGKTDIQILDVRTAEEFKTGHIKNALQADWKDQAQFKDRVQYVDKTRPVYIYCLVGGRSAAAASWMRENGFNNVIELQGGINAWKKAGKPVEGSSNEPMITLQQYQASIPDDKMVLVDFGATWCPPCVKMAPVLDELQKDKTLHFIFIKIDAGVQTELMKALNVDALPTLIIYKKGKEKWRNSGIIEKKKIEKELK